MSEFDFGFGCSPGLGDVDSDRGVTILTQFNNAMTNLYSPSYNLTVDELIDKYPSGIVEGLGLAANATNMSDSATAQAMTALARAGHGLLPKTWNGYFGALNNQAMPSEWMSAIDSALSTVNEEVVQPVLQPAEQIIHGASQSAIAVGNLATLMPFFLYAVAGLVVYSLWKDRDTLARDAGKAAISAGGLATGGLFSLGGAATRAAIRKLDQK